MPQKPQSTAKQLVLVGGGHSHAIVLKQLRAKPIPGLEIILISNTRFAPYSGMLPGHIAGFYSFEECHIDLEKLAKTTGIDFIVDEAVGLDLQKNLVFSTKSQPIKFDFLSVDIGSTPATLSVPGAAEYAISAKPVPQLLEKWKQLLTEILAQPQKHWHLAIVGGGAGGVELALALEAHLGKLIKNPHHLTLHLLHKQDEIMSSHSQWVRRCLTNILTNRGIQLHLNQAVSAIKKTSQKKIISCESGLEVECDEVFWVTQASAPAWLKEAGLTTDERGFILVNDKLQSLSHPQVFAAGDIASIINSPTPKAGVFAVRQGKPLYENLACVLQAKPLKPYQPQKQYLSLIGTGTGEAIASRGNWGFGPSQVLWWWKDWIDRRFMKGF
ncbi:FAD-dependent oxidoreductase [Ancylothrix sp. C2]|uniref:FAD-dependent oxidoreductase n=1 Tax=Ancylothrix sp. D3o TaxID=2953691 RepID=UPI0021BB0DEC|nr:FAD-dependent oxidoreductase [Ancylothrix sp. D3o]MCT7948375.1 FAD-dependent oxidoreductase [Ancylothrix sp. D3o]